MGWNNRVDVARHKALKVLKDAGAWDEVIVPTFQNVGTDDEDDDGTVIVPDGTKSVFTENLLRNIIDLDAGQQVELCGYLAKGKDKKGHAYNKLQSMFRRNMGFDPCRFIHRLKRPAKVIHRLWISPDNPYYQE